MTLLGCDFAPSIVQLSGDGHPSDAAPRVLPAECAALPAATTALEVGAADASQLPDLVASAAPGTTVLLADGVYALAAPIVITSAGVSVRGGGGDAGTVRLDGSAFSGPIVDIVATDVTLADVSLGPSAGTAVRVAGGADADTRGVWIYRVTIVDVRGRAVEVLSRDDRAGAAGANADTFADDGAIACSSILLGAGARALGCDRVGAVRLAGAARWRLADNLIRDVYCDSGLRRAIDVGAHSRDSILERNRLENPSMGIFVGEDAGVTPPVPLRPWSDWPTPEVDHLGGIARNNVIFTTATLPQFDSGITLWRASGMYVVHNTVFSTTTPYSSIEWRYAPAEVVVVNNLVSHNLRPRDGAVADATYLPSNVENATADQFVDAAAGDLHLAPSAAVRAGVPLDPPLPDGLCPDDADRDPRDPLAPDVGADERP